MNFGFGEAINRQMLTASLNAMKENKEMTRSTKNLELLKQTAWSLLMHQLVLQNTSREMTQKIFIKLRLWGPQALVEASAEDLIAVLESVPEINRKTIEELLTSSLQSTNGARLRHYASKRRLELSNSFRIARDVLPGLVESIDMDSNIFSGIFVDLKSIGSSGYDRRYMWIDRSKRVLYICEYLSKDRRPEDANIATVPLTDVTDAIAGPPSVKSRNFSDEIDTDCCMTMKYKKEKGFIGLFNRLHSGLLGVGVDLKFSSKDERDSALNVIDKFSKVAKFMDLKKSETSKENKKTVEEREGDNQTSGGNEPMMELKLSSTKYKGSALKKEGGGDDDDFDASATAQSTKSTPRPLPLASDKRTAVKAYQSVPFSSTSIAAPEGGGDEIFNKDEATAML